MHWEVHGALQVGGNRTSGCREICLLSTGEKLIYTPGHKRLYPFQKAFCFAFPTASFLPSNCLCTCPSPVRVLRPSGFSSFPLLLPVHRHRSSQGWVNPALSHFIPLAPWATQHTLCHNNVPPVPTACLSPASLLPLRQKSNFQVFLPTLPLYLSISRCIFYNSIL